MRRPTGADCSVPTKHASATMPAIGERDYAAVLRHQLQPAFPWQIRSTPPRKRQPAPPSVNCHGAKLFAHQADALAVMVLVEEAAALGLLSGHDQVHLVFLRERMLIGAWACFSVLASAQWEGGRKERITKSRANPSWLVPHRSLLREPVLHDGACPSGAHAVQPCPRWHRTLFW